MSESYLIPTAKILERLRFENPWWKTQTIHSVMEKMKYRLYFDLFFPLVEDTSIRRAVILMGPRRVGKTVMMHHAIHKLLKKGVSPQLIHFIGIDNPLYVNMGLEELLQTSAKAAGNDHLEGSFVFFDEIQYQKDWERHLKILVDSYPHTKFIVSGSAAAALLAKSSESGAGRFHDFNLPPLTFQEFLHLQDLSHLIKEFPKGENDFLMYDTTDIKTLNEHFFDYLNYGGYPEVIFNETIRSNLSHFVKNDIVDKVLLRDLPSLYGIKDVQELNRFFTYLAFNSGREFSPQKIAKDSGLRSEVIKRYMTYLEAAFLIKVVNKVDENARYFKRITSFKIYLTNPSLRTALFSPVIPTDDETGNIVETAIYAQWMHRENIHLHYAKWKMGRKEGEVDLVQLNQGNLKVDWALEIKWSNRYFNKPADLKSLLSFCEKNKLNSAWVTSIDKIGIVKHNQIYLKFCPVSLFAYMVGANTLNKADQQAEMFV